MYPKFRKSAEYENELKIQKVIQRTNKTKKRKRLIRLDLQATVQDAAGE